MAFRGGLCGIIKQSLPACVISKRVCRFVSRSSGVAQTAVDIHALHGIVISIACLRSQVQRPAAVANHSCAVGCRAHNLRYKMRAAAPCCCRQLLSNCYMPAVAFQQQRRHTCEQCSCAAFHGLPAGLPGISSGYLACVCWPAYFSCTYACMQPGSQPTRQLAERCGPCCMCACSDRRSAECACCVYVCPRMCGSPCCPAMWLGLQLGRTG